MSSFSKGFVSPVISHSVSADAICEIVAPSIFRLRNTGSYFSFPRFLRTVTISDVDNWFNVFLGDGNRGEFCGTGGMLGVDTPGVCGAR